MKNIKKKLDSSVRILFVLAVLASTFVFAMFQGGKLSWTIFYVVLPFILYSILLFLYPMSGMIVQREIRTPNVQSGGKLIVSLSIKRKSPFPLLYTVVTDKWAEPGRTVLAGSQSKRLFLFGIRKDMKWVYEIERVPRGEYVMEGIEVEVSDFFGWIRKKKWFALKGRVLVFPKTSDIQFVPIDTHYDQGQIASPLNIVKDTTMATSVRNYQAGDRVTWIHWKSFARTQTLMTKEFEDRRSQELFLIMDGRNSEVFEDLVELTASILKEALEHQAGLALMTTGAETSIFPFIQSEEHLHNALVHLAKIKPFGRADGSSAVMESPPQHGGGTVVITANPDWAFLQSILHSLKNDGTIACYVVADEEKKSLEKVENDIRFAKSKGIQVRLIKRHQFSQAFQKAGGL